MTKHLRFLFVMLLAMIWSAGWAAVGDTYQKVTSESELSAGDIIVFASDSKNMAMAGYKELVGINIMKKSMLLYPKEFLTMLKDSLNLSLEVRKVVGHLGI